MPTDDAILNLLGRWGCKPIDNDGVCCDLRDIFAPEPDDEEIASVLRRFWNLTEYTHLDAIRDIRALFANPEPAEPKPAPTAETARIQGFADGLAKGIEHRSGRMSVRLAIAKDLLAGLGKHPSHYVTNSESGDSGAIRDALKAADALIAVAESEKS